MENFDLSVSTADYFQRFPYDLWVVLTLLLHSHRLPEEDEVSALIHHTSDSVASAFRRTN